MLAEIKMPAYVKLDHRKIRMDQIDNAKLFSEHRLEIILDV
jgi:hypothetical protein